MNKITEIIMKNTGTELTTEEIDEIKAEAFRELKDIRMSLEETKQGCLGLLEKIDRLREVNAEQ
jgi:hypothetical protein